MKTDGEESTHSLHLKEARRTAPPRCGRRAREMAIEKDDVIVEEVDDQDSGAVKTTTRNGARPLETLRPSVHPAVCENKKKK